MARVLASIGGMVGTCGPEACVGAEIPDEDLGIAEYGFNVDIVVWRMV